LKNDAFVYNARGTVERQKDYAKQYAPLVRRIAHQMIAKLPANVELDDMIQAGMIGLMDAVNRFEESQGTQFEVYAASRIRGSMLDELRAGDWLPRSARKNQRDIENAIHRLEQRLQRAPQEGEIAQELHMSVPEYQELLGDARGAQLVYFDDLGGGVDGDDYLERHVAQAGGEPLEILRDKRFRIALVAAIEDLPEREKLLMSMYYEQDLNLREIGAVMGVTESRVCQLHSQAVSRLRAKLKSW
jgi:RNA polymerase sigma factor for flagellar operon FliA